MSCEKKTQKFDRFGDPINSCDKGFDNFMQEWEKIDPRIKNMSDQEKRFERQDGFYDDFRHNKNITVKNYFKKVHEN